MSSLATISSLLTIVLVHGAWEDASIWSDVTAELEGMGHVVHTVNLPGRAGDTTPTSQITLDSHRDAVLSVVQQSEEPVVLVGHSFGGMTISAVAEAAPEKVERLIYLAAYLPQNGQSLQDLAFSNRFAGRAEFRGRRSEACGADQAWRTGRAVPERCRRGQTRRFCRHDGR